MKQPRISDFDPKATPPLKSPLDDMPAIGKPAGVAALELSEKVRDKKRPEAVSSKQTPENTPVRPYRSPSARTPVRVKRTITRYAFEFFLDQVEQLKKYSLEEQAQGEKGSMSLMVREALDAYIAKRTRTDG